MQRSTKTRAWRNAAIVLILAIGGALAWVLVKPNTLQVWPWEPQCGVVIDDAHATLTIEQSVNASIMTAEAQRRSLKGRAVSIALATALQESGLRNLDYGDRDSLGLFQQRPSQGWGTPSQIQDPWYASARFYEALVKVKGWETSDINDVAQLVQISGHPQAYRKHVSRATLLTSGLSGEAPASFGCKYTPAQPKPDQAASFIKRAFPKAMSVVFDEESFRITSSDSAKLWSATSLIIANGERFGLSGATIGQATWTPSATTWSGKPSGTTATLSFKQVR